MIVPAVPVLLQQTLRQFLPWLSTALLLLLSWLPWVNLGWLPVTSAQLLTAPLLAGVFYWSIHRPDKFGPVAAFTIGLLGDVMQGLPLGAQALVFLLLQQVWLRQRRFFTGGAFVQLWWAFALSALLVHLALWLIMGVQQGLWPSLLVIVWQSLVAAAIFPLLALLFIVLQRRFLQVSA